MRVLAVNAGSSSLKLTLLGSHDEILGSRVLAAPHAELDLGKLLPVLEGELTGAEAVAHRVVHGGQGYQRAVLVTEQVRHALGGLVELAPLHQPKSLAALDAVTKLLPDVPAVACFDTAFHSTLPAAAATYALPREWNARWGLRRYGFHGLSHAWIARRVPELLEQSPRGLRIVSAHLGAGASLCAIADGRSVDTTMGFTPLEGLVMATRSGSVDPGLLVWLLEHEGLPPPELGRVLEHESGLLGLTGTGDMGEILGRVAAGDDVARLALEVYVHRLRAGVGAMAASLGGVDVIAFTGGVGENSAEVRARAVAGLRFLGLGIDEAANRHAAADCDLSSAETRARTLLIHAREDLELARQARDALAHHPSGDEARPASR